MTGHNQKGPTSCKPLFGWDFGRKLSNGSVLQKPARKFLSFSAETVKRRRDAWPCFFLVGLISETVGQTFLSVRLLAGPGILQAMAGGTPLVTGSAYRTPYFS